MGVYYVINLLPQKPFESIKYKCSYRDLEALSVFHPDEHSGKGQESCAL